jgi:hypothetical protein
MKETSVPKESHTRKEGEDGTSGTFNGKKGNHKMQSQDKYQGNTGKTIKGSKLATRGTASFNGKSGQTIKIGTDSMKAVSGDNNQLVTHVGEGVDTDTSISNENVMGTNKIMSPNIARPLAKMVSLWKLLRWSVFERHQVSTNKLIVKFFDVFFICIILPYDYTK